MVGHLALIACNYKEEEGNANEDEAVNQDPKLSKFLSPSLSVPGIMGWLTGLQHRPISGKRFNIPIYFDQDC